MQQPVGAELKPLEDVADHRKEFTACIGDDQAIALARTMLASSDLIAGRLVRLFQAALPLKNTYWIICPKATRSLPKIIAFRDWLLEEVAADRQRLASVA